MSKTLMNTGGNNYNAKDLLNKKLSEVTVADFLPLLEERRRDEELVDPDEALIISGAKSKMTLYNWVQEGRINKYGTGRKIKYKRGELMYARALKFKRLKRA